MNNSRQADDDYVLGGSLYPGGESVARQTDTRTETETGPGANRLRFGLAGVVALTLLALVGWLVIRDNGSQKDEGPTPTSAATATAGCGGIVDTATGECLGPVTNASTLHSSISEVAGKILAENQRVAGQPRYVKVALLTPLSVAPEPTASAMSMDQVRFSMQGAYVALRRANTSADFGDKDVPAVQLLLVNQGSAQPFRESLVERILELGEEKHPLVAVVGLGTSKTGTEQMAEALSKRGIPMVGAVTSATTLTAAKYRTFHSVSPSNTDYVLALKDLLDKNPRTLPRNAIVVRDVDADPYTQTLTSVFVDVLKDYIKFPPRNFSGSSTDPADSGIPTAFSNTVTALCSAVNHKTKPLQMVFFSGRLVDFPKFAEALKVRTCNDEPLTVIVAATGFQLSDPQVELLNEANVTVMWASSADAGAWIDEKPGTPRGFADFLKVYRDGEKYPPETLNDGYAMMYHDALASAVRAIRMAVEGDNIPRAGGVQLNFSNLAPEDDEVIGATGTLSFGERADIDGRATGKAVTYRQLGDRGPRLPAGTVPYLTK